VPAIDVGFYLDEATVEKQNCLWVIPGTHKLPDFVAAMMIESLVKDGFKTTNAIPVPVQPGDVILHNILVLHGSSSCTSPLRRTVYYEFRSIPQELKMGPHKPEYVPLKQKLLVSCLCEIADTNFDTTQGEHPNYVYSPDEKYNIFFAEGEPKTLSSYRFPHKIYFKEDYKG